MLPHTGVDIEDSNKTSKGNVATGVHDVNDESTRSRYARVMDHDFEGENGLAESNGHMTTICNSGVSVNGNVMMLETSVLHGSHH